MKKFKKFASLLLVVVMVFAFCIPTLAAEVDGTETYKITIENATADKTYTAYKVFDATYNNNGGVSYTITSDNPWYNLISEGLSYSYKSDGETITETLSSPFTLTETKDADGNEFYVVTTDKDDATVIKFFQTISEYELIPSGAVSAATGKNTESNGSVVLDVTKSGAGYYFVTSTLGSVVTLTTVTNEVTVIDKNEEPTMVKKIVAENENGEKYLTDWDTDAMEDEVEFLVNAYVPKYVGGNLVLDYMFNDVMTEGLELEMKLTSDEKDAITTDTVDVVSNKDTGETEKVNVWYLSSEQQISLMNAWAVLVDSTTSTYYGSESTFKTISEVVEEISSYTKTGDFTDAVYSPSLALTGVTITENTDGTYTLVAQGYVLTYYTYNTETYKDSGEVVTDNYPNQATLYLDYTAVVDQEAEFEEENTIDMDWWVTSWLAPNPDEPTYGGEIESETENYETELEIIKQDGKTSERLEGAVFTLTGTALHEVKTTTYTYTEVKEGEDTTGKTIYYKNEDGTFTTEVPDDTDASKYTRETKIDYQDATKENVTVTVTTGTDGTVVINGLDQGTYELTELVAPDGYNLLSEPITIEVSYDHTTDKWTFTVSGDDVTDGSSSIDENGVFILTVNNNSGTELPGTGGMGTTIFYVIGIILVLGAVVILVTRRRMRSAK